MKIEFGFQANCSELVTHLGFTTKEEIALAMKQIQELSGWSWRLCQWRNTVGEDGKERYEQVALLLPVEELEELIQITEHPSLSGEKMIGVGREAFLKVKGDILPEDIRKLFIGSGKKQGRRTKKRQAQGWQNPHTLGRVALVNIPSTQELVSLDGETTTLDLWMSCDCEKPDINLRCGDHDIPNYPLIHELKMIYGTEIHPQGSGSGEYLEWLGYHFIQPRCIAEEEVRKYYHDDPGHQEYVLKEFQKHPPLPGSEKLREDDLTWLCRCWRLELEAVK